LYNFNTIMDFFDIYRTPSENFILYGALISFCLFVICVLSAKLASGKNCYTKLNRAHMLIFVPYISACLFFAFSLGEINLSLLPVLAAGSFIYFTLHYVYLFAIVGLIKKSISVNLLADIAGLDRGEKPGVALSTFLACEKEKLAVIRLDRLNQMEILNMAEKKDDIYTITPRGRLIDRFGGIILKTWNLRRL